MKKVKIILTALTVVAAVGGTLAFKSAKFSGLSTWYTTTSGGTECNVATQLREVTSGTTIKAFTAITTNTSQCKNRIFSDVEL